MLFVIDVGNTNTVLGVFARVAKVNTAGDSDKAPRYERLVANWRVATSRTSTVDEYGVLFRNLFSMAGLESNGIHGIVISSVVPPLDPVLRQVCERYFNLLPLSIEPGVKTGMPFRVMSGDHSVARVRVVSVRDRICGTIIKDYASSAEKIKVGDSLRIDTQS